MGKLGRETARAREREGNSNLLNTNCTAPPARSMVEEIRFWAVAKTVWIACNRVSMMERKMSKMEVKREVRESITLDMVVVGGFGCLVCCFGWLL